MSTAFLDRIESLDATRARRAAEGLIADLLREVLVAADRTPPATVRSGAAFKELGLDSLTALALADRLGVAIGTSVPPSLPFDHPTPAALAAALVTIVRGPDETVAVQPIDTVGASFDEPVAIVSMACRYPGGVNSPEDLWQLLVGEVDAIGPLPTDRGWNLAELFDENPDNPGTSYARDGGFLQNAAGFDPGFFNISPREALAMDPQQRVLLEVTWEALERAAIDPQSLRGSQTGIFVGAEPQEYGPRLQDAPDRLDGYLLTGAATSVLSGRLSYVLGLNGPTLTVDTACSASLVALHLAMRSLRSGECDLAVAGGVAVMSSPGTFTAFSRQRGLARDGRCKAFSADADGTGWAEGAGMLVLERLADARAHGHQVLAVLRGSAVNSDGASNGLTAPNGPAQQRVIRAALADAGLGTADVDLVEAHGTGTSLGDPIEAQAILSTYGDRSAGRRSPARLGSLKSNIGHAQAAAGVGGVIKVVQALRHEQMPATLHVGRPSDKVDWTAGDVELLTTAAAWPDGDRPRRGAVSSFGISGTNAHVIVEQAPPPGLLPGLPDPLARPVGIPVSWPLSARTPAALQAQAGALENFLRTEMATAPVDIEALGAALATRSRFEHTGIARGRDAAELLAALAALSAGDGPADATVGTAVQGDLAVLFTGQGAQRPGMGAQLYAAFPVFRDAFDAVCEQLDVHLDIPLRSVVLPDGQGGRPELLDQTGYTQPAIFAFEVALYRLVESWGVLPDVVGGHSVGEIAAAHVAGVLTLDDAAMLVGIRATLMQALPGVDGAMVAIAASEQDVLAAMAAEPERFRGVGIAAVNGPLAVVVAGSATSALALAQVFSERGRRTRRLTVSHAFHSPLMEPMLAEFGDMVELLSFSEPVIPMVSGVTGRRAETGELTDPAYWVRHVRDTVRFADAVSALSQDGVRTVLEIGPDAVLTAMIAGIADAAPKNVPLQSLSAIALMRRDRDEIDTLIGAMEQTWVRGHRVALSDITGTGGAIRTDLPTYPFQRERYWLDAGRGSADLSGFGMVAVGHPLVGAQIDLAANGGLVLSGRLAASSELWLADHVVSGTVLVPGTAFLEMAVQAGDRCGAGHVEELVLETPLALADSAGVTLQVSVGPVDDREGHALEIFSRAAGDVDALWTRHATGYLAAAAVASGDSAELAGSWPPPGAVPVEVSGFYDRLAAEGYAYGPAFRGVRAMWQRTFPDPTETFALLELPADQDPAAFALHPALLDAALQTVGAGPGSDSEPQVPFSFGGVQVFRSGARTVRVRAVSTDRATSLLLTDPAGEPVAVVHSVVTRPLTVPPTVTSGGQLFEMTWQPAAATPTSADRAVLLASAGHLDRSRPTYPDLASVTAAVRKGAVLPDFIVAAANSAGAAITPHVAQLLSTIQSFLAEPTLAGSTLVLAGTGIHEVAPGDRLTDAPAAAALGLIRSAQAEHPGRLVFAEVDDPTSAGALFALLPGALAAGEEEVAVRGGAVLVPRLRPVVVADGPSPWSAEGTVLITGGTGGLGFLVARHLVTRHGVRHLVLVSRRGADAPGAVGAAAELAAAGAAVEFAAVDAADAQAMSALLAAIPAEHPLQGIVHAAGVLDDGLLQGLTADRLQSVMSAKSDAAWLLHDLTVGLPLTAFVLFSSAAATLEGTGQGNYAAANASLEALARQRHQQGLPATAIGWTLWSTTAGMAGALQDTDLARIANSGLPALDSAAGLALLDAAVTSDLPVTSALRVDAAVLRERALGVPAMLRAVVRAKVRRAVVGAPSGNRSGALADTLSGLDAAGRLDHVRELVRAQAASALGFPDPSQVQPDRAFSSLGLDSLAAVDLRNRLNAVTGLRLPATLVFDHPNVESIAGMLAGKFAETTTPATPVTAVAVAAQDDPIVIVGMGCRYPGGVGSAADLWNLVIDGRDGITDFPVDRGWNVAELYDPEPGVVDRTYCTEGGFLHDAGQFDGDFFGISPREALATDPQQRLLLEASWEALEDAAIDPLSLRGSRTGVFAGVMYHDFASRLGAVAPELKGYIGNGGLGSVVSGRVSYTFGFEGPAVTVDTACSSSLVALHQAVSALRGGECDLALAGGVTVMTGPDTFVDFSLQRGLAVNGRCKSYSDEADGTGWGEGVGVLVLERLSDAQQLGHTVLAVIRGSAVNQDGASNGLTAPNGPAQQKVIEAALAAAGLRAADIDLIEGHGTGTTLGDPIEAQALLATYGQQRDEPAYLGSLKSNIGHTQAAAGVGGIIKVVQAIRHGQMPPSLYCATPTRSVDWADGKIALLDSARWWPAAGQPRRAAVSSFGISGTNAHVIIEEYPTSAAAELPAVAPSDGAPWVLSGKSESAVRRQAGVLAGYLSAPQNGAVADVDVAATLWGRSRFEHRAVVLPIDRLDRVAGLRAFAAGDTTPTVATGVAGRGFGGVAVVFPGQGAQRVGMCAGLHEAFPVFAAVFDAAVKAIDTAAAEVQSDWVGLRSVVFAAPDTAAAALLHRTRYTQPALFAVETALYALTSSLGVVPAVVAGHSVGEVTAAHVAGVFTLADAARLVVTRGAVMDALPAGGAMTAIAATEADVLAAIADLIAAHPSWRVDVAAVNSPTATVISGDTDAVAELTDWFAEAGVRCSKLTVSHAFHSALMDPAVAQFERAIAGITFHEQQLPVISDLTGQIAGPGELQTAGYWARHIRAAVRWADTVTTINTLGVSAVLEVGPDSVLTAPTQHTLDTLTDNTTGESAVRVVGLQRRDRNPTATAHAAIAQLFTTGAPIDYTPLLAGGRHTDLPTYAFDHQHYWLLPTPGEGNLSAAGLTRSDHPLLSALIDTADGGLLATGQLSLATHAWLADHRVHGRIVVPGTGVLDMAGQVGRAVGFDSVRELVLVAPLVVPAQGGVDVRVTVSPEADAERAVQVHSRHHSDEPWTLHAAGSLVTADVPAPEHPSWPPVDAEPVDLSNRYRDLTLAGLDYGPVFAGLTAAWRAGDSLFGEVSVPTGTDVGGFGVHPALLDAALHTLGIADEESSDAAELPFTFGDVVLGASGARAARVHARRNVDRSFEVSLFDATGSLVVRVGSLVLRAVAAAAFGDGADRLLSVSWIPLPSPEIFPTGPAVLVGGGPDVPGAERIDDLAGLERAGAPVRTVLAHLSGGPATSGGCEAGPAGVVQECARALALLQSMVAVAERLDCTFVLLTRSAVGTDPAELILDPTAAALRGVVKAAIAEHPGRFVLLDHDGDLAATVAVSGSGEPELALRAGKPLTPRLVSGVVCSSPAAERRDAVLITGGTSGLGARLAEHLATQQPGRQLVLLSRRGANSPDIAGLIAALDSIGAETFVLAADVADEESVRTALATLPAEVRIGSVVHGAGVLADATVAAATAGQLSTVFRPKLAGLHTLERVFPDVDEFVVFSSVAATLDASGQGSYAAANSALDAWAHNRRVAGRPGLSIAWGLWGDDGMGADLDESARRRIEASGVLPLSTADGLQLFDAATGSTGAGMVVAGGFHLPTIAKHPSPSTIWRELLPIPVRRAAETFAPAVLSLPEQLTSLDADGRKAVVHRAVRGQVAEVLGYATPEAVDAQRGFGEMGFDSLAAVELRNRLIKLTGCKLPTTVTFDFPNVDVLSDHLLQELVAGFGTVDAPASTIEEQLDRLERMLADTAPEGDLHTRIAGKMQALTAAWVERGGVAAADRASLASVSADELFGILDEEFDAV